MKFQYLAAVSMVALVVSGCTSTSSVMPGAAVIDSPAEAPQRVDVNPGYKAGEIDFKTKPTRSLDQIMAKGVHKAEKEKPKDLADKLRAPAMQETALTFGTRAGLAYETTRINARLQANAAKLTQAYNFQRLMIQGPNNTMVSPPIISEARDAWEAFDAGKTLRVADTVYEIIDQARFSPVAPMWQTYLITSFDEAQDPPDALLPQNESEKDNWNKWLAEGYQKGREQAHEIFQANLDRLNRDFTGMVRYRELLEEKKVSPPVLAVANLGATGTGNDMRVNDQAIRMTAEPTLQVQTKNWDASATTVDAKGQDKGPDKVVPPPAVEKEKPVSTRRHTVRKPKPVSPKVERLSPGQADKTTGGSGRF